MKIQKAKKTRDVMLAGIKDESMKRKAELLANAAISGNKVTKMSVKLISPDPETA